MTQRTILGSALLRAHYTATEDPTFNRVMYDAMKAVHDEAFKRELRFGDIGFGTSVLAMAYSKSPTKGNSK